MASEAALGGAAAFSGEAGGVLDTATGAETAGATASTGDAGTAGAAGASDATTGAGAAGAVTVGFAGAAAVLFAEAVAFPAAKPRGAIAGGRVRRGFVL